jgi:hypothetical protein
MDRDLKLKKILGISRKKKGAGIFDSVKQGFQKVKNYFSPNLSDFNNTSKKTISEFGNYNIVKLQIYRTPISSILEGVLNFISMGKWNEMKRKYTFDKLFHLALVATVSLPRGQFKNIIIEKNEVVNVSTSYTTSKDTEIMDIKIPPANNYTVYNILDRTKNTIGPQKFFSYDAFRNNCQFFIYYILNVNGLMIPQYKNFLFQDLTEVIKGLPSYLGKVARFTTDTAATFNKITGGEKCCCKGGSSEASQQVKGMSNMITGLVGSIPGMEPVGKIAEVGYNFLHDNVLEPIFFRESEKERETREEWDEYVRDKGKRLFGVDNLNKYQWAALKHEMNKQKVEAKNEALSKGIADFEALWRSKGFNSAAEYRADQRKKRSEELRRKKQELQGMGKTFVLFKGKGKIPTKYLKEADKVYSRPSLYRSIYAHKLALKNDPKYKKEYEKRMKKKEKIYNPNQWFKEEWVNVGEYLKGNKMECGKDTKKFPSCRPLKKINDMTPTTLPELIKKYGKEKLLQEIKKKEANPDYRINWNNL